MEEQAEKMLSATAERLKNYPVLKERILAHLGQTRQQGRQVRERIVRRGGTTSAVERGAGDRRRPGSRTGDCPAPSAQRRGHREWMR